MNKIKLNNCLAIIKYNRYLNISNNTLNIYNIAIILFLNFRANNLSILNKTNLDSMRKLFIKVKNNLFKIIYKFKKTNKKRNN